MSRFLLKQIREPRLQFGSGQTLEDPRDGLSLFGPLDTGKAFGVRPAVIGTPDGVKRFVRWSGKIQGAIDDCKTSRPAFPGFEAAFGIPFATEPVLRVTIDPISLANACRISERHQRVHTVVRLYTDRILETLSREDEQADVWFVIVTEEVYASCRPESIVPKALRIDPVSPMTSTIARRLIRAPSMFDELNRDADAFAYQPHFHNQLKAVLLASKVPTQILRESTIAPLDFVKSNGQLVRRVGFPSEIAWNVCTTAFYKSGARPWKIAGVRPGVCYLGVVFKRDDTHEDGRYSSCGAQMFLDSGDGLVFKGAGGPWYSADTNSYHLSEEGARELVERAIATYQEKVGDAPTELFIHGRARFDAAEWRGFLAGAPAKTKLVGVRIRSAEDLRIFRPGRHAILRGLSYVRDDRTAFLWANGFIPRLQTYPGREIPKGLLVDICNGYADIDTVMRDVLSLTKLNYNACIYGDGEPVTLKFADAVGEILTAGPVSGAPLPFRLYI